MYCTNCGVALEDRDAFCSQCGAPTASRPAHAASTAGPRLTRSLQDRKIAGVCGGLADYLAVDPTLVRLMWLIATICFPPFLLGYIAAWIVVPNQPLVPVSTVGAGIPQAS